MGIVYEDKINCHDSAYFSVDRMGGIQYNTDVCFWFANRARRNAMSMHETSAAMTQYDNIFIKDQT